jgi:putative ABC transport system substrate-binding protein
LQELGWTVGRNIQIDFRWVGTNADRLAGLAAELVALALQVILVLWRLNHGTVAAGGNPVGAGYIASMAQPGGNTTGFTRRRRGRAAAPTSLSAEIS